MTDGYLKAVYWFASDVVITHKQTAWKKSLARATPSSDWTGKQGLVVPSRYTTLQKRPWQVGGVTNVLHRLGNFAGRCAITNFSNYSIA